jgi:hypothetical protein
MYLSSIHQAAETDVFTESFIGGYICLLCLYNSEHIVSISTYSYIKKAGIDVVETTTFIFVLKKDVHYFLFAFSTSKCSFRFKITYKLFFFRIPLF